MTAPARYAHEVYPAPQERADEHAWTRYHLARAQGFWRGWMDGPVDSGRHPLLLVIAQGQLALTCYASLKGYPEPARWARERSHGELMGEWLWEAGTDLGLPMDTIAGYPAPSPAGER